MLGDFYITRRDSSDAVQAYEEALRRNANAEVVYTKMAWAFEMGSNFVQAAAAYRNVLAVNPNQPIALNNLAWRLATAKDPTQRNGAEAVQLAERACNLTKYKTPLYLGTLAAAYAETGRFQDAVQTAERAASLALESGDQPVAQANQNLVKLYTEKKPYRTD